MIRLASPDDQAAVATIVNAAYAPYIARIGRKPAPMLDDYATLIRDGRVYVLDIAGVVTGVLVVVPEHRAMLLDNIAVRPDRQGRGYGRKLLAFAERLAREASCGVIRLYTNEAMTENIALYSRIGFVETHRAEEDGFRRIHMRKVLVPVQGGPASNL